MKRTGIKKLVGICAGVVATLGISLAVMAQQDMTVYITDSGSYYHLDGCSSIKKTKIPMMLSDTKDVFDPCPVCNPPSNQDVDRNDIAQAPERPEVVEVDTETEVVFDDEDSIEFPDESEDTSSGSTPSSNSTSSSESSSSQDTSNDTEVRTSDSEIATSEEEAAFFAKHKDKDYTGRYAQSQAAGNSNDSSSSDKPKTDSSSNSRPKTDNTSNSTSNSGGGSPSSGNKTDSTSSTVNGTELISQSTRRAKYGSKTNPKRGEKPATTPKPASNGYMYADFATFNAYDSENHLGGTPIYIMGTVTDIAAFIENKNPATGAKQYRVGIMLKDADGYDWYLRAYVTKDKYEEFKAAFAGQTGYFYGGFAGYSGVMTRPMMDAVTFINAAGVSVDLSAYCI